MTKTKIFCLIMIFNTLLLIAYNQDQFFNFVNSLEKNNLIQEAITEYKRFLFFNKNLNDREKGLIWLKLSVCYRKINIETEMMNAFNKAYELIKKYPRIKDFYEEIIIFLLSRGKSGLARLFLDKLKSEKTSKKIISYLTFSYLLEKDWDRFFKQLNQTELTQSHKNTILKIVKKMKQENKRYKLYKIIAIFIPGIGHCFYGDFLDSGESLLFHYFFLQEIFSGSSLIGKILNAYSLTRLYLKTNSRDRKYLKEKLAEKNLPREEKIFHILFNLKKP